MSQLSPDPSNELNGIFKHVHNFGSASEKLFRRIYGGLSRRTQAENDLKRQQLVMDLKLTQAQNIRDENRRLKRKLEDKKSELERLYGILASIDEGIIMQEIDGRITMINSAAEKMLGGKKKIWESALGTLFEQFTEVKKTTSELMPLGESERLPLNDRIVQAHIAAIGDEYGDRIGTIIILRDVTRDALAERLKDGFVTHISHELKTPMTVIKLASDVLSGQAEDEPANRKILDTLTRNVDILDRLVLELLDISEMAAGTFDVPKQVVGIERLIWDVAEDMESEIKNKKVDLFIMTRDIDRLSVLGDDKRLQWALGHLIRNGAYYNQPGGMIAILASIEVINDQDYVLIRVRDDGVGISDKDLPHIFERFYRGDARTDKGKKIDPRGLGQGLFVARTISEVHGGYIGVKSQVGSGSEFTIAIPAVSQPVLPESA